MILGKDHYLWIYEIAWTFNQLFIKHYFIDKIMNIISKNNIVPSERLIEKYKSSKQSEKLNLPDFDYLKSKIGISQEKYEYIKEVISQ